MKGRLSGRSDAARRRYVQRAESRWIITLRFPNFDRATMIYADCQPENHLSTEQNKSNYRRFIEEAWNKGNVDTIDEIVSPDVVLHSPPGTPPGPDGVKQVIASFRAAFPDVCITIEDQIAERDRTVTRLTITGTHRGPFRIQSKTLMPTGKAISVQVIDMFRHDVNGKLAECWSGFDVFGMLQQLGAIPARDVIQRTL